MIKATVPADRLLVWNVKEGWEPLCTFLGKAIPNKPIPNDNKTGDPNFIDKYYLESDFGKEMIKNMKKNIAIWLFKYVGIITLMSIEYRTGWKYTKEIGNYLYQTASNYF